jgi:hypothetical protein
MKSAPARDATQPDVRGESDNTTLDRAHAEAEALTDRVLHALERVTWPAHPDTLIENAEQSGAQGDVIAALRNLPDEAYGSFPEVSASIIAAQLRSHETVQRGAAARR